MKNYSKAWYDALAVERFTGPWPSEYGPGMPMLPFVTCPLPPALRKFFREHGEVRYYQPGESIIQGEVVKGMQVVESGLSCRVAATLTGQSGPGLMAMATPHRFATGNLNVATRRSQIGEYIALSKVTTRRIAHAEVDESGLLRDKTSLRMLLSLKETIHLSDRMALAISAILPANLRFASFMVAWGTYFGTVESGPRGQRIRVPVPGRTRHFATVANVSEVTMEKILAEYRQKAGLERDGDFWVFDSEILQEAHEWMRGTDGEESFYTRPPRIESLFEWAMTQDVSVPDPRS